MTETFEMRIINHKHQTAIKEEPEQDLDKNIQANI